MKKLAFILTLMIVCSSLLTPVLAASKADPAGSSSSSSSAPGKDSGSNSSKKEDSKDTSASKDGASKGKDASSSGSSSDSSSGSSSGTAATNSLTPPFADQLHSEAVYILNLDSGQAVWSENAQLKMYPASLTKIMTCIVALESGKDLANEKTTLKAYIQNELYNQRVDTLGGIYQDDELSIEDLLYAMMVQSANEAAMMVADYIGDGNLDLFCEMMNKKAKEIGANNTNFSNPTGLHDENNYSTAYDLALITQYAMTLPAFKDIVTARVYTSSPTTRHPDGITWYTSNYMQIPGNADYYYEGLQGVKTGSLPTEEVGGRGIRNFASTATRNGYTYLMIVLGAPERDEEGLKHKYNLSFFDTRDLYDWTFSNFTAKTLMNVGDEVAEVPVKLSWDKEHIKLVAADKFASLVPNETTADSVTPMAVIPEFINAPVKKGQVVGYAKLMLNGLEVGRVNLVAAESVAESKALLYLDKVKTFFDTFIFKFVLTFAIVILVLYIGLMIIRNRNKRRYQMRRRRPPPK